MVHYFARLTALSLPFPAGVAQYQDKLVSTRTSRRVGFISINGQDETLSKCLDRPSCDTPPRHCSRTFIDWKPHTVKHLPSSLGKHMFSTSYNTILGLRFVYEPHDRVLRTKVSFHSFLSVMLTLYITYIPQPDEFFSCSTTSLGIPSSVPVG